VRELRMIGKALASTKHPILVHIIRCGNAIWPVRYAMRFDDFSNPVPLDEMKKRLDVLAGQGTSLSRSAGRAVMHPEWTK